MRTHFSNATPREASTVRYMDMLKKGYARPSFAADSADTMWRSLGGTCSAANLPPITDWLAQMVGFRGRNAPRMAAEMMGSVGVRHAAMTRDEIKSIDGNNTNMTAGARVSKDVKEYNVDTHSLQSAIRTP